MTTTRGRKLDQSAPASTSRSKPSTSTLRKSTGPATWSATTSRERPDGHLDRSELLAVGPVALREFGHHRGRPRSTSGPASPLQPARRTASPARPSHRARPADSCQPAAPRRAARVRRERFHVHAPPSPLGERRSDRIQYGITGADVHPEAPPVVRAEGAGKHHILLVLRIRHERITAHLSAPAPVRTGHRSPNDTAVVTSCPAG